VKSILHITPTYLPLYLQLANRGTPGLLSIKERVYLMHDHLSARHVSRQDVSIPQSTVRRKKNGPTFSQFVGLTVPSALVYNRLSAELFSQISTVVIGWPEPDARAE
jgi:Na+-translocating ferredoxin:NAD+ oxidoreductase RnfG subunit